MSDAKELKVCPFCGVGLIANTSQDDLYVKRYGTHWEHPSGLCFMDGAEVTPSQVDAWNSRAAPIAPTASALPAEWEMEWPQYSYQGMGCGLEDRGIIDPYDAMRYGWDEAMEQVACVLANQTLYTVAPAEEASGDARPSQYAQGWNDCLAAHDAALASSPDDDRIDAERYRKCREHGVKRGDFLTPDDYDRMVDESIDRMEVKFRTGHNYGKKMQPDGTLKADATGPAPLPEATRKAMGATPTLAKVEAHPVEVWHGDRKVTIYADSVLRVWGPHFEDQISDAPRTLQSVQDAMDWLFTAPPAASAQKWLNDAARDVIAERQRQVEKEGWTPEHDDGANDVAAMADAAACYAMHAGQVLAQAYSTRCLKPHPLWPWDKRWWKPTTPRRDLVKAGALILAEIERIDRALLRESEGK